MLDHRLDIAAAVYLRQIVSATIHLLLFAVEYRVVFRVCWGDEGGKQGLNVVVQ